MPIGVPTPTPITVMIRLPTMALSKPPAEPGGGVILVKTLSDRPPTPFQNSVTRMSTSQTRPKAVAAVSERPSRWRCAAAPGHRAAASSASRLRSHAHSMKRAAARTKKVITNRIRPSAISEE